MFWTSEMYFYCRSHTQVTILLYCYYHQDDSKPWQAQCKGDKATTSFAAWGLFYKQRLTGTRAWMRNHIEFSVPCYHSSMPDFKRYWTWWRQQMETFSALLAICVGNSPLIGEFPSQMASNTENVSICWRHQWRGALIFFDLRLNIFLSEQWWGWWFETPSRPSWHHCTELGTGWVVASL